MYFCTFEALKLNQICYSKSIKLHSSKRVKSFDMSNLIHVTALTSMVAYAVQSLNNGRGTQQQV